MKKKILLLALFIAPSLMNAQEFENFESINFSVRDLMSFNSHKIHRAHHGGIIDFNGMSLPSRLTSLDGIQEIENIQNIFQLLLVRNKLNTIDTVLNLPLLNFLDLHRNELNNIIGAFDYLPNLFILNLSFNSIDNIIGAFDNLPKLKTLHLAYNHISDVRGAFNNLYNLKFLCLSHNHISKEDQAYLQGFCDARDIELQIDNQTEDPLAGIRFFKFAD